MAWTVSVIVPVYGDWESLRVCIDSLKKYSDPYRNKVILVNDCGPEADDLERKIKQAIRGNKMYHYFRNPKNLGFVGNCNRAVFELDKTHNDILLLNSDAEVTDGFLEELQATLKANKNICAVSPRSNNATIATIPLYAQLHKGLPRERSYNIFRKYHQKLPQHNVAPTAHGFCMLIRRTAINELGLFDEVFGRGYGEEIDFCQRAQNAGWISAIANHAFVFHQEARSFSLESKQKLVEHSTKIISERYPKFSREVQEYIKIVMEQEKRAGIKRPFRQSLAIMSRRIAGKLMRTIRDMI